MNKRVYLVTNGEGLRVGAVGQITRGTIAAVFLVLIMLAMVLLPMAVLAGWLNDWMDL